MATRTEDRTSERSSSERSSSQNNRRRSKGNGNESAFSFGDGAGPLIGAAIAGIAIGVAANFGRKALMQGIEAQAGDWDDILAAEHRLALAVFDKMLATDETQTFKRKTLLLKLSHALDKHAHQEEMVVYPALREANEAHDADLLEGEHGYVKTYLYELSRMSADSPAWIEKVREFRGLIAKHAMMEEQEVFPRFKQGLSTDQNKQITSMVNRDGFWMA